MQYEKWFETTGTGWKSYEKDEILGAVDWRMARLLVNGFVATDETLKSYVFNQLFDKNGHLVITDFKIFRKSFNLDEKWELLPNDFWDSFIYGKYFGWQVWCESYEQLEESFQKEEKAMNYFFSDYQLTKVFSIEEAEKQFEKNFNSLVEELCAECMKINVEQELKNEFIQSIIEEAKGKELHKKKDGKEE